jgi:hypothetical protein
VPELDAVLKVLLGPPLRLAVLIEYRLRGRSERLRIVTRIVQVVRRVRRGAVGVEARRQLDELAQLRGTDGDIVLDAEGFKASQQIQAQRTVGIGFESKGIAAEGAFAGYHIGVEQRAGLVDDLFRLVREVRHRAPGADQVAR